MMIVSASCISTTKRRAVVPVLWCVCLCWLCFGCLFRCCRMKRCQADKRATDETARKLGLQIADKDSKRLEGRFLWGTLKSLERINSVAVILLECQPAGLGQISTRTEIFQSLIFTSTHNKLGFEMNMLTGSCCWEQQMVMKITIICQGWTSEVVYTSLIN